jgi:enoyl-CoA hydratase/carnithine racemase
MMAVATYEKRGNIGIVTLNRPEAGNALNQELHDALWAIWKEIRFDADVWTTILTGSGEAFCAGEDEAEIAAALASGSVPPRYQEPRDGKRWGFPYEHYKRRKLQVWKPTIVAVNGRCDGAGLVFLGQCDAILASETATFSMPDTSKGMVPVEASLYLADRVPLGVVTRMALLGASERLDAQRARQVSLVSEVHAPGALMDRALEVAEQINDQAGDAVRGMLISMHMRRDMGYDDALTLGYEHHERFENVANMKEGPLAFTEKRKAQWAIRPPHMG